MKKKSQSSKMKAPKISFIEEETRNDGIDNTACRSQGKPGIRPKGDAIVSCCRHLVDGRAARGKRYDRLCCKKWKEKK
jgi:hypothetical protein